MCFHMFSMIPFSYFLYHFHELSFVCVAIEARAVGE